jgi:hypothetical protein
LVQEDDVTQLIEEMTVEELQEALRNARHELRTLRDNVNRMRTAQRTYFREPRGRDNLERAKALEGKVDRQVGDLFTGSLF